MRYPRLRQTEEPASADRGRPRFVLTTDEVSTLLLLAAALDDKAYTKASTRSLIAKAKDFEATSTSSEVTLMVVKR